MLQNGDGIGRKGKCAGGERSFSPGGIERCGNGCIGSSFSAQRNRSLFFERIGRYQHTLLFIAAQQQADSRILRAGIPAVAAGNLREGIPDGKRFAVIAQNGIRVSGLFGYTREYVFSLGCSGRRQYGVLLLIPEHADAFVRIVPAAGHPDFLAVIHKNISAHHAKQTGCHFDFFNV